MASGLRWLSFAILVLTGYLTMSGGDWFGFLTDQERVADFLNSNGLAGLSAITLLGALFTGFGAPPRQVLAFVLGFAAGSIQGAILSTIATAIGATGCFFCRTLAFANITPEPFFRSHATF